MPGSTTALRTRARLHPDQAAMCHFRKDESIVRAHDFALTINSRTDPAIGNRRQLVLNVDDCSSLQVSRSLKQHLRGADSDGSTFLPGLLPMNTVLNLRLDIEPTMPFE